MLDTVPYLRVAPAPHIPVHDMVIGKPVREAATLLPRIFNLCREAQGIAACAAFDMPLGDRWQDALRTEILREHVIKLCLKWPGLMCIPGPELPRDWQSNAQSLRACLFGATGALPQTAQAFDTWITSSTGIAPMLRALRALFAPGDAVRPALPEARPDLVFQAVPQENSAAARHAHHPVMQAVAGRWGRGPLWSALGVAYDAQAVLEGVLPPLDVSAGRAVVPAARGFYGISARVDDGIVTAFERVTPTDHLLAPGGALTEALHTLPRQKALALAPLVLSVMDPCFPVAIEAAKEVSDA